MKLFQFDELTHPYVPEIEWETRFSNRFCDPQLVHQTYMELWTSGKSVRNKGLMECSPTNITSVLSIFSRRAI